MSRRGERQRGVAAAVTAAVGAAVGLTGLGLWARALNGPLWPDVLTDWSLGSALLAWTSAGVGAVVATRLPRNNVGWLFVAQGALTGLVFSAREITTWGVAADAALVPWTAWVFAWVIPVNMTVLALLPLLFPYGSPPSRRWRAAVVAIVVAGVAATVAAALTPYSDASSPFTGVANPVAVMSAESARVLLDWANTIILLGLLVGAAGLVQRLRTAPALERQQVKAFGFASVLAVTAFIVGIWFEPVFVVATLVAFPAVPVAAGVAVLRYRLYDIDRVISRTLAWALLSAVLVGVYLAAVTLLTQWLAPVTGRSPFAVAAATLLAAAAFGPARQRIQAAVDRRFNRARYDAERVTATYRSTLRDEVDLTALQRQLLTTVQAAVQPSGLSLWLPAPRRGDA